jgi:hypothetical protein
MNPYWIVVALSSLVQFLIFVRWLHRRTRDDEIRRAFIRDMAINHLPHLYHALREIVRRKVVRNWRRHRSDSNNRLPPLTPNN